MLSAVTVEVIAPLEPATDEVPGVLPQPGGTSDLSEDRPEGVEVAMTFHWPKSDRRSLRRCLVRYGGRTYRVVGDPQPYVDANCPGRFYRAVACEAADG